MLYEFYKFFISQSTFQRPISAFLFKNNSTKILVMLAVSTSFTQVPEKQLIRILEQCAVVYVFKWKVKNSKTLPSVSLLTRGSWASGRPLRCSRPRQSPRTDGAMLPLLATNYKHNIKLKEGRPDAFNASNKLSFSLLYHIPDFKNSGPRGFLDSTSDNCMPQYLVHRDSTCREWDELLGDPALELVQRGLLAVAGLVLLRPRWVLALLLGTFLAQDSVTASSSSVISSTASFGGSF